MRQQAADIAEVHNHKVGLAFFFTQTGTTTNDLLEFGHGAYHFIQHDQLCHLAVRAGGQQLGSRCDNGVWRGNRNEIGLFAKND